MIPDCTVRKDARERSGSAMPLAAITILTAAISSPQCLEQQPFLLVGLSPPKAHQGPLAGGQVASPEVSLPLAAEAGPGTYHLS